MGEIPEGVLAQAGELVNATIRNYENEVPAKVARDMVAMAILAERQRCAYIVKEVGCHDSYCIAILEECHTAILNP